MKKWLLPLGTLALLFALAAWNGAAMDRVTGQLNNALSQCSALGQAEKWDGASEVLQQTYQDWTRHQAYLHIVLEHAAVDGAEAMFQRAMAFAATKEPSEFCAEIADLMAQLSLLAEMERLSIKNIL